MEHSRSRVSQWSAGALERLHGSWQYGTIFCLRVRLFRVTTSKDRRNWSSGKCTSCRHVPSHVGKERETDREPIGMGGGGEGKVGGGGRWGGGGEE